MPPRPPGLFSDLASAALGPGHRPARVLALIAGILLLSFADLYMTLVHLRGTGMIEANPLARGVIALNSPAALILWKGATVGLAASILYYARRRPTAELAAVFCCAVLCWLTVQWARYNSQVSLFTAEVSSYLGTGETDPNWVAITPEP